MYSLRVTWVGIAVCILIFTCARFRERRAKANHAKIIPPTAHFTIPFVDHFLGFLCGGFRLFSMLRPYSESETPIRFNLFGFNIFLITSAQNIRKTIYNTHSFSDHNIRARFIRNVFGVPEKATDVIRADTSGSAHLPLPGSNVAPERRIIRMQQESTFDLLASPIGINAFLDQLTNEMEKLTAASGIGEDWVEYDDLFYFIRNLTSTACINALCGQHLLEKNPGFVDSFWVFDNNIHWLHVGIPAFLKPDAYKAQRECLDAIVNWKREAIKMSSCKPVPDSELWDEVWGLKIMRDRHAMYERFPEFDETAQAGADLGILWASNDNLIPTAYWVVHALLTDPSLLTRSLVCIDRARLPPQPGALLTRFDANILLKQPLLQSIYHEVLRTKITSFIARGVEHDHQLGDYHIPRGSMTLTIPWLANHDRARWEKRPGAAGHPVEEFWADRFLVYGGDTERSPTASKTAPSNQESKTSTPPTHSQVTSSPMPSSPSEPEFSLKGLSSTFMPFGVGHHVCPGRHFATRAILAMAAMLVASFEFEPLGNGSWDCDGFDYSTFGYTPIRPGGKKAFRVRRKMQR